MTDGHLSPIPVSGRPRRLVDRWGRGSIPALVLSATVAFVGCSGSEPELSDAEILNELEGRELTTAELAEREQVANTLCRLDDAVLVEVWDQLSAKQLEFQDFVFSRTCDNRSQLYAEATGRFAVTSE